MNRNNCLRFFLVINIYINFIYCSKYKEYNINKYCSNGNRLKTIELEDDEESSIVLTSGKSYKNYMDCAVDIETENKYGIIIAVKKVNLRPIYDDLEIEINSNLKPEFSGNNYDLKTKFAYVGDRKVRVKFSTSYSSISTKNKGFELVLTTFRKSTACKSSEMSCGQNICISSDYMCDGYNNCGDNSDEITCVLSKQTNNFTIVGALVGVLVALLVLCYCCKCCGKSKKRHEYIEITNNRSSVSKTVPNTSDTADAIPSAPISSIHNQYPSSPSYPIRFAVNPNYPYFGDESTAPPYPVAIGSHPSAPSHQYSHLPPPPYTENDDHNSSNHIRENDSKLSNK